MYQQASSYDLALELSQGGDYTLPDEGPYKVKFLGVHDKSTFDKKDDDGNIIYDEETGEPLKDVSLTLQFVIDDDESEFDGCQFRSFFPLKVTTGNKSGRLWAALLGVPVKELPTPLPRINEFIGKRCTAMLKHKDSKKGNTYAYIDSVSPLPRKKQRSAPVAQLDDEDDGGF